MDNEVTQPTPAVKPDRTLLAILVVVGLLVVIALVVVLVRSGARESLDPSTPEGVVQRYAQAVIDGDEATAGEYLSSLPEECEYYEPYDRGNLRLTFQSTDVSGDTAIVRVSVSTSYGGDPFSNNEYSSDAQFTLVAAGQKWLIEQTPYEFISCDDSVGK